MKTSEAFHLPAFQTANVMGEHRQPERPETEMRLYQKYGARHRA